MLNQPQAFDTMTEQDREPQLSQPLSHQNSPSLMLEQANKTVKGGRVKQINYDASEIKRLLQIMQGMKLPKHDDNYWPEVARMLNDEFHRKRDGKGVKRKFYMITKDKRERMKPFAKIAKKIKQGPTVTEDNITQESDDGPSDAAPPTQNVNVAQPTRKETMPRAPSTDSISARLLSNPAESSATNNSESMMHSFQEILQLLQEWKAGREYQLRLECLHQRMVDLLQKLTNLLTIIDLLQNLGTHITEFVSLHEKIINAVTALNQFATTRDI